MPFLMLVTGYLICGLIGLIGIAILWQIFIGKIDLSRLISEPNGDASMSRFQFLVFTFVIALSLFLVIAAGSETSKGRPAFPESIPGGVLVLLGISGSSYAVGKAIQFSDPAGVEDRPLSVSISPTTATVKYGAKQQFSTEVARKPDAKLKWEIIAGPTGPTASIDDNGLFTAPSAASPVPAPHATVKVSLVDFPDVSDLAVVSFTA